MGTVWLFCRMEAESCRYGICPLGLLHVRWSFVLYLHVCCSLLSHFLTFSINRRVIPLETALKDPCFIAWSKTSAHLAVGTSKGNLLIYNKTKKQKVPVVGKHSKRITCGSWSRGGNKLALGAEDRSLTISNENGETLIHTELKHAPLQTWYVNCITISHHCKWACVQNHSNITRFSYKASDSGDSSRSDNTISANLGGKSLLLFNIMDEKEDPLELTFAIGKNGACKYGNLIEHTWYDDGMLLIGFSDG